MPLDGAMLSQVKQEIETAVGARVDRITQPGREELIVALRGRQGAYRLLISVNSASPRVHFTRAAVENIAYIAALIAVNLAVMNLLPLPALDGGRIFFLIINAAAMLLFRKQIPAKYENYIHFAGLILLLALMVVLVFSDVGKLIH